MENIITINSDLRTLEIPAGIKNLGVEYDDDVRRLHFRMPKVYDGTDLSGFAVRINYMNANNDGDVYPVTDKAVEDEYITFSWLVGRLATAYKGNVRFIVCMKESDAAGEVLREFNTTPASLPVLEGLETADAIWQKYPDVLEAILLRLSALEDGGLPKVTDKDNGKFLQAAGGAWVAVDAVPQVTAIIANYLDAAFIPVTQDEYEALDAAGAVDPNKYYMIVGDSE